MSPDMSTYRIDLLPENDRTTGWATHLPPRAARMRLARAGIAHLKEQIEAHRINCDWREKGKYHAAVTVRGRKSYNLATGSAPACSSGM